MILGKIFLCLYRIILITAFTEACFYGMQVKSLIR